MSKQDTIRKVRKVRKRATRAVRRGRTQWLARRARGRAGGPAQSPATAGTDPQRLVPSPVFLLSSVRSGSTLLRVVLNSHPQVCAPHEMHLRRVKVNISHPNADAGMTALGLSARDLENLVWDRVLHLQLQLTGKSVIVDKTPQNTFDWQRLLRAWPDARYLVLLRHPVDVYDSIRRAWGKSGSEDAHYALTTKYARALAEAREQLPNLTVRYEDFVADPAKGSRDICEYLGVEWDESMLRYAEHDHGAYRGRLGDWSKTIRSGVIRPPKTGPREIPPQLREACELLGYA